MVTRSRLLTARYGAADDSTNAGTDAGRQDDEGKRELLRLGLVYVGNQTKSDTATGS